MLSAQAIRFLPRLFLLALAVEVARSAFLNLWERLVVLPSIRPGTIFSPEAFNFASSLVTFMISPCVLFVGLYYMSRAYSLDLELKSIGSSLFLGGAVGAVLSLIVAAESFYGSDVSGLANYLATELSSAWVPYWWTQSRMVSSMCSSVSPPSSLQAVSEPTYLRPLPSRMSLLLRNASPTGVLPSVVRVGTRRGSPHARPAASSPAWPSQCSSVSAPRRGCCCQSQ